MESNDINEDERESRTQDYDPSFLDEILGPDYFDDMKKTDTKKEAGENKDSVETEIVTEKAFCLGCESNVNVEDPKIKDIAMFAFNTYASNSGSDKAQTFVKVTKAKTQVVAGSKYTLTILAGYLNCSQDAYVTTPGECAADYDRDTFLCDFVILEQPWANTKKVLSSVCHEKDFEDVTESEMLPEAVSRRKREVEVTTENNNIGKLRAADEDDEYLRGMANYALEQLDEIDADNEARLLVDMLSVKKQTVSGWLYHLKLRVAQTTCEEGKGKTLNDCRTKIQLPFVICNVKVLVQPWQTVTKKVTESQCFPEKMKASKKL
ncbi:unnamed protein product, partial [Allacma fusca]